MTVTVRHVPLAQILSPRLISVRGMIVVRVSRAPAFVCSTAVIVPVVSIMPLNIGVGCWRLGGRFHTGSLGEACEPGFHSGASCRNLDLEGTEEWSPTGERYVGK